MVEDEDVVLIDLSVTQDEVKKIKRKPNKNTK